MEFYGAETLLPGDPDRPGCESDDCEQYSQCLPSPSLCVHGEALKYAERHGRRGRGRHSVY